MLLAVHCADTERSKQVMSLQAQDKRTTYIAQTRTVLYLHRVKTRRIGALAGTPCLPALPCTLELPLPFTATDAVATPACLELPATHVVYLIAWHKKQKTDGGPTCDDAAQQQG